jgi:hypothetical protein
MKVKTLNSWVIYYTDLEDSPMDYRFPFIYYAEPRVILMRYLELIYEKHN